MHRCALALLLVLLAHGSSAAAQCGKGLVGDGVCGNGACCSEFGVCGRNASHCGFGCKGGPCLIPAQLIRVYVDQVPVEALGLDGGNQSVSPPAVPDQPPAPPKAPAQAVVKGQVYGSMEMTPARKRRAMALSSMFDSSRTEPQYGYCEFVGSGLGIAFGFAGFTTGSREGARVVEEYCLRKPTNILCPYQAALQALVAAGGGDNVTGLDGFCVAVRRAAVEAPFIEAQQAVHGELYWQPLMRMAAKQGLKLPLTISALYDTIIQHGVSGADDIAAQASYQLGGMAGDGVDEKQWLQAFLARRRYILFTTPGKADVWVSSARRVDIIRRLAVEAQCWALNGAITIGSRKPFSGCWVQDSYYGSQYIS